MWSWFVRFVERLLKIPPTPVAPPGDEGTTRVFRAAPRYYTYRMLGWLLSRGIFLIFLFPAIGALGMALDNARNLAFYAMALFEFVLLLFVIVQTVFSFAALRLDYEKRWYLVTDRSLRIRQGVMHVTEMTITFANIQNISITQGPIQRMFGISDLRVDTAGGSGAVGKQQGTMSMHTAFFQGVDDADRIRSLMQERLKRLKDAGLGDLDDRVSLAAPALAAPMTPTPQLVDALRQVLTEAKALRAAV